VPDEQEMDFDGGGGGRKKEMLCVEILSASQILHTILL
jgi:hypothetical protein